MLLQCSVTMSELLENRENMVFAHRQTEWKETGRHAKRCNNITRCVATKIVQIEMVIHLIISVENRLDFSVQSC